MAELLTYEYRIPVSHVKRKKIYQFSDTHLVEWDALSSEEEVQKAFARTAHWEQLRFGFARSNGEPSGEKQSLPAKTFFLQLLEESKKADALIMAGDIIDFDTDANTRLLASVMKEYPVPYLPLRGNHDEPDRLPEGHPLKSTGEPVQKLDLGDMVILGFDNSKRIITAEQNKMLQSTLQENKPVLITMHIPIMTQGNWDLLQKCGEYFQLNYQDCPKENIAFIETIRENADKVIAVTCGHLHFNNVSEICPGVMQYVSSQGLIGSLSVYDIGE